MALIHNTNSIITNGLVLALDAANPKSYPGSGTTWSDLSGLGNNGTLVNGVGYTGSNGGSLTFNGSTQYADIGSQSLIGSGTAPFAVEIWFYNTRNFVAGQYSMLFTLRQSTGFFVTLYNPSGSGLYLTPTFRGQTQWAITVTQSDYVNKWVCLSLVYTGGDKNTASSFVAYRNGVQLPTGGTNFSTAGGTQNLNYIAAADTSDGYHQGNIAAYKVYNRALSASEISQNYNALKSRYLM